MTNHPHKPFLTLGAPVDDSQITSLVAAAGHPHLVDMAKEHRELLKFHTLCHILGDTQNEVHDQAVERLAELRSDLDRGFKAVWS